jgi:antirestriction protein ArdC
MASQQEIRERVTKTVIAALESGVSPWHHMPWSPAPNTGFPENVITRRRYSGVNPLLLQLAALERGWQSKWWGSVEQWTSLGGQVTGYGTSIVLRQRIAKVGRDRDGERHAATVPVLREQVVFNADQVTGAPQFQAHAPAVEVQPDFGTAEQIVLATGADIREVEADKAWYFYPPKDHIEIPPKGNFCYLVGGLKSWYDTAFHELCHWSEPRLGWVGSYDLNEMRAEMGAGLLSAALHIPSYGPTCHHHNHVEPWVNALRQDHRAIFRVSAGACAAVKFILSFSRVEGRFGAGTIGQKIPQLTFPLEPHLY